MADVSTHTIKSWSAWASPGLFWLTLAILGAGVFFADGLDALLAAWQLPEYSHGPLIPVLSALLFLRQLKEVPVDTGPKRNRWVGVMVILVAIAFGGLGRLSGINDIVAYATILWVGGILLVSFGWATGKHFWPPVLHLVYMLPLPGVLYYKLSAWLQLISSELGVWFLKLLAVPVFLDGNIIDLGVAQAACGRGLLGTALPLSDSVVFLHLRSTLQRPHVAQSRPAARSGSNYRADEFGADRRGGGDCRPLRNRMARRVYPFLRRLGDLHRLYPAPVPAGPHHAVFPTCRR